MAAAGLVFFRGYGRRSQFGSSCRDTGSSDCIDDHHGTGIEVFDPSEKKCSIRSTDCFWNRWKEYA